HRGTTATSVRSTAYNSVIPGYHPHGRVAAISCFTVETAQAGAIVKLTFLCVVGIEYHLLVAVVASYVYIIESRFKSEWTRIVDSLHGYIICFLKIRLGGKTIRIGSRRFRISWN